MDISVFGVIAPHPPIIVRSVGGDRADVTRSTLEAMRHCADALATYAPETIVLMSPHAPAFSDVIAVDDAESLAGSLSQFGDVRARVYRGDPALADAIVEELDAQDVPAIARSADDRLRGGWLDHAAIVPLDFLDPDASFALVTLSLSMLGPTAHRALGAAVARAASRLGRKAAFVASGDLSHRLTSDAPAGYSPKGALLDRTIVDCIERGALMDLMAIPADLSEEGGECGLRSFVALGGFCGPDPVPTRVLSYEGPWGVGYLTALVGEAALAALTPDKGSKGGMAGADQTEIVALARATIEHVVRDGGRSPSPAPDLRQSDLPARAGVFVSLHRQGALRGCIGTIMPIRETLADEVVHNAIAAATDDPRFDPVCVDELADLEISVDVLTAPESCDLSDLDPKTYGVIVTSGWKRGLLLPDLEGVDDVKTQVGIAMRKGGIRPGESCSIERFRVDRYT